MINPSDFYKTLIDNKFNFYTGVPDSLLKSLCAYIDDNVGSENHIIPANEGNSIGIASGHYLATGNAAVVYMQNSGLGNAVNPLTSLSHKDVYKIPMLLIIGWRGEPGKKDEPQHMVKGAITKQLLEIMDIPYLELEALSNFKDVVLQATKIINDQKTPCALLVKAGTFLDYSSVNKVKKTESLLRRDFFLEKLITSISPSDLVISTTGKTSRELYEIRRAKGEVSADFLTVGSMGHCSSIALGVALKTSNKKVICIDGDGAMLMHMGAIPIISKNSPGNFIHILLNNYSHESVGGQSTSIDTINMESFALSCGYKSYSLISNEADLGKLKDLISMGKGPLMIEVRLCLGSRDDLGRPKEKPQENKELFMAKCKR